MDSTYGMCASLSIKAARGLRSTMLHSFAELDDGDDVCIRMTTSVFAVCDQRIESDSEGTRAAAWLKSEMECYL